MLVVQRTGWGKSAVYFVATRLLRDAGAGPTLIVSPLLGPHAQPDRRRRARRRVDPHDQQRQPGAVGGHRRRSRGRRRRRAPGLPRALRQRLRSGAACSPGSRHGSGCSWSTRCTASATGATTSGPTTAGSGGCSTSCRRDVPVLGTTATANDRVVADVQTQFGEGLLTLRGPLARSSLVLDTIRMPSQAERLAWLATVIPTLPGTGIVYCLTVADAARVAGWLSTRGHRGRGLQRRDRSGAARRPRGTAPRERDQGARRDVRARHGLRQAGPRVRRPLPVAGLAHRLLPAGRPGRAGAARRARRPAERLRGPRHPGLLHPDRVPAARPRGRGRRAPRRRATTGSASARSRTR